MSMLLAAGSWALFAAREAFESGKARLFVTVLSAAVFFAMALTGGRMGYVTWALIGLLFGALRWRRIFIFGPAALAIMILIIPAAQERLMQGFDPDTVDSNRRVEAFYYQDENSIDLYTVTSGRTFAWPWVLSKIEDRPFIGHGREAMIRTGLAATLWVDYGESFPHPHNAYLQWLLDNGILGFIPILLFYFLILKMAIVLFKNDKHDLNAAIGGIAIALLAALLIASMGSQSFYPREGSVGMWCAIGLALRVFVQQQKAAIVTSRSTGLKNTVSAQRLY
jgi:O-antigen ligase